MDTIGTIRTFKTANFKVIIDAVAEDYLDLSWDDDGSVARGLDDGSLVAFVARARVIGPHGVELASDYLGGCVYGSLEEFEDHRECGRANQQFKAEGKPGGCGSYFADMVSNVCRDARVEYARLIEELQTVKLRS
jgi:hypothetical protein